MIRRITLSILALGCLIATADAAPMTPPVTPAKPVATVVAPTKPMAKVAAPTVTGRSAMHYRHHGMHRHYLKHRHHGFHRYWYHGRPCHHRR